MEKLSGSSRSFRHALLPISSSVEEKALHLLEEEEEDLCAGVNGEASSSRQLGEKKQRLNAAQLEALEKDFEEENKIDPDRKARLARELGLQPRQVAVWFQNRRARWKTKQLERDFAALRSRHHALELDCDALRRDKGALLAEIGGLRARLAMESNYTKAAAPFLMCKDGGGASDSCDSSTVAFNDESLNPRALMAAGCSSRDHGGEASVFSFLEAEELLFPEQQEPSLTWYSD